MDAVARREGALLVERVRAQGVPPNLVPSHAGDAGRCLDRLVGHHCFVGLEVPVGQSKSRPLTIGQNIEVLVRIRDARLREAVAARWRARED